MKRIKSATTAETPATTPENAELEHFAKAVVSQGAPFLGMQYIAVITVLDQKNKNMSTFSP